MFAEFLGTRFGTANLQRKRAKAASVILKKAIRPAMDRLSLPKYYSKSRTSFAMLSWYPARKPHLLHFTVATYEEPKMYESLWRVRLQ